MWARAERVDGRRTSLSTARSRVTCGTQVVPVLQGGPARRERGQPRGCRQGDAPRLQRLHHHAGGDHLGWFPSASLTQTCAEAQIAPLRVPDICQSFRETILRATLVECGLLRLLVRREWAKG